MQFDFAVAVLTFTASLLDVLAFGRSVLTHRFAIGDLWAAHVGFHAIFALHSVHENFQVEFAHSGNQRLAGVRFSRNTESRIFLCQALHRHAEFVLVRFGLRLDSYRKNWSREIDGLQNHLLVLVAQRVSGVDTLQTNYRANVAGINLFNFFALVSMHLQHAADAFARALAGVVHVATGFENAGINADIRHMTDEWVGHNLKSQRGEWRIIRSAAQLHFIGFWVHTFKWRNVRRRRQVIDHRIEQRLNAFILKRRTSQHRHDLQRQRGLAD